MPVELEAKISVKSHEPIRSALRNAGATYIGRVLETNHLLDRDDHSLRDSGCGLRVRTTQVLDGSGPGATMTFKGPKQPGAFKQREEHETPVANADAALAILRGLGNTRELVFEKRRETWRMNDCTIELDEVPVLGCFVEVEGETAEAIEAILKIVGLNAAETISDSYVAMLAGRTADEINPEFRF